MILLVCVAAHHLNTMNVFAAFRSISFNSLVRLTFYMKMNEFVYIKCRMNSCSVF